MWWYSKSRAAKCRAILHFAALLLEWLFFVVGDDIVYALVCEEWQGIYQFDLFE